VTPPDTGRVTVYLRCAIKELKVFIMVNPKIKKYAPIPPPITIINFLVLIQYLLHKQ